MCTRFITAKRSGNITGDLSGVRALNVFDFTVTCIYRSNAEPTESISSEPVWRKCHRLIHQHDLLLRISPFALAVYRSPSRRANGVHAGCAELGWRLTVFAVDGVRGEAVFEFVHEVTTISVVPDAAAIFSMARESAIVLAASSSRQNMTMDVNQADYGIGREVKFSFIGC